MSSALHAQAVTSAFTYQGELRVSGQSASTPHDFRFELYDAASGGTQIGPTVNADAVPIVDGLFSSQLDFGASQFAGDRQWLQIAVRPTGNGAYQPLSPRTEITATPYAQGAITALSNSVTSTSIVNGSVQTVDIANGAITGAKINSSEVQARIVGGCTVSQAIRSVSTTGSIVCSDINPGTITGVSPGTGLTGGGSSGNVSLGIANGGVGTAQVNPSDIQLRVTGSCPAGQYLRAIAANGGVTCAPDVSGNNDSWGLTGNSGLNPNTNFLGTTDQSIFALRANNLRVLQFFNGFANQGPNILGGSHLNAVNLGQSSQTVAGGGSNASNCGPNANQSCANQTQRAGATVSGGLGNTAAGDASVAAGGSGNTAVGAWSTVSGGMGNFAGALGTHATVAGGEENHASGGYSSVGGGTFNTASRTSATVSGGNGNAAAANFASVLGGMNNSATGQGATVAGGQGNCAGGVMSFAAGQFAKVRPGNNSGAPALGCEDVPVSGASGDFGTFIWADLSSTNPFVSTGVNQYLVRATGGVAFNTNSPRAPFTIQGTNNQAGPGIGNGWGDFTIGDATYGLSIGVDTGGVGAGTVVVWPKGGEEDLIFSNASSQTSTLTLRQSGRVGVRRLATTNNFEVEGNASKTTSGSWLANSDERIKTDIQELSGAVDQLLRLRPVHFRYQSDYLKAHPAIADERYYNVIAQEFADVFPDAVRGSGEYLPGKPETPENEIKQVDFHPATVLNLAATQELAVRLALLEADNRRLRADLAEIRAAVQSDE